MADDDHMNVDLPVDQDNTAILENQKINEEYKIWKKHAPLIYDTMYTESLTWPTLTTQWLPDKQVADGYDVHRLIFGTHTSEDVQNYLQIAQMKYPHAEAPDPADYNEETGEIGGHGAGKKSSREITLNIVQRIDHEGEVNKARYMPQNPNIIATMCNNGQSHVFDRTKHTSEPTGRVNPQIILSGHSKEGFALNWNPWKEGQVVTGSNDKTVKLWEITDFSKSDKKIKASRTFSHHSAVVNDVEFHPIIPWLVATVSDDLSLQMLDLRQNGTDSARKTSEAHSDAINAVSFNPGSEYILATGSADQTIGIWDLRKLSEKLASLEHHTDMITKVAWHPTQVQILASASDDRRLIYWDLSRCGEEQTPEESEDGPPELLFMHGGHTNKIADFAFNKNDPWLMCSAAEDNLVMMWKPTQTLLPGKPEPQIPLEELEH